MKHEYHEGPKASGNFKALATLVLQKPKESCGSEDEGEGKTCWQETNSN